MTRFLARWMGRAMVVLAAAFVLVYGGDWVLFKLRGSPLSTVSVNRYVTIPLKGNKQEFDYLGSFDQPCARSLFPQAGLSDCWQLRRQPNQGMTAE
jgi:hypothetical protein